MPFEVRYKGYTVAYPTTHQWGRSALSLAAEWGRVDVMKVLIEGGADVYTQNKVIMYGRLHYLFLELAYVHVHVRAHVGFGNKTNITPE